MKFNFEIIVNFFVKFFIIFFTHSLLATEVKDNLDDIDNECIICMNEHNPNTHSLPCCKKNICRTCLQEWSITKNREAKIESSNFDQTTPWNISSVMCPHCKSNLSIAEIFWPTEVKELLIFLSQLDLKTPIVNILDLETLLMIHNIKNLCNIYQNFSSKEVISLIKKFLLDFDLIKPSEELSQRKVRTRSHCIIM